MSSALAAGAETHDRPVYATRARPCRSLPATNVDAIRLRENGIACRNVERAGASAAADNQKPGLLFRFQAPSGVWRQIDPLEREVRVRDQKRPRVGKPCRRDAKIGGAGVRHRKCVVDVKLTLAAVIEKTKCRVAALLDFRNHKTCADRVDRSGGRRKWCRPDAPPATRQDPRSSHRRWPDAIAAG